MGLDAVELLMEVEETFGIELPDSEAEGFLTPGLLIEAILRKVQTTEQSGCLSRRAFYTLRRILMQEFHCQRKQVTPDTPLESLVPRPTRLASWARMKELLPTNRWPALQRSRRVEAVLFVVFVTGAAGFVFAGFSLMPALLLAIVPWGLARAATIPLCTEFPNSCRTAGQLAHFLVAHAPKLFEPAGRAWTRSEVAEAVRRITIEQLGLKPGQYREDARFVQDLGVS